MLTPFEVLLIAGTTALCTAASAIVAFLLLRLLRGASMAVRMAVVVVAVVAAIVTSTLAIASQMMVSPHDLEVVLWVISIAAVLSLGVAWLVGRSGMLALRGLRDDARRVGEGAVVAAADSGWREVDEVSAQLAEASNRLMEARVELERLDATRQELFAWISHDLRTPLTGIRALAESLDEDTPADPRGYVRRIRTQADSMSRLVDDLFELSRLHSGALRLRCATIELLDVVSDAVVDVHALAAERGIRIVHAGVAGHTLWADPHELTRVVVNLLANAIRHAPAASVITVSAHRRDDGHLVLGVLDQGSGVAAENLGRMFEVGWQASQARTARDSADVGGGGKDSSGAGLGLAIVRGIVEAHGGSVHAQHVGAGFELQVALPERPAA